MAEGSIPENCLISVNVLGFKAFNGVDAETGSKPLKIINPHGAIKRLTVDRRSVRKEVEPQVNALTRGDT